VNSDPTSHSEPDEALSAGPTIPDHPTTGIPLPEDGLERLNQLDDLPVRELAEIPAVEVITRCGVLLMSAAAEKLGLAPDGEPFVDLDEARRLINALAGLVAASQEHLGMHRQPLRDGVRTLQAAFREAAAFPDPPGEGPGERWLAGPAPRSAN
jgi:hypothetical protein